MSGHTHPAIAYSLQLSAGRIRLSRTPSGWTLSTRDMMWSDFLAHLDLASQRYLKTALDNLRAGDAGTSLTLIDRNGLKWAMTATCVTDRKIKGGKIIAGGLVSLASEQSQRQMREIINHLPSLIWYKDNKNRILSVNSAAAASVGLTIQEVEGLATEDLFPEMAAQYLADDLEVIHSGRPRLGYIERLAPADRADRWVRTDKIPVNDPVTGGPGVVAMSTDVTQLVELERRNADLNRRFTAAAEASRVGLWEYSLINPGEAWWSDEMFNIVGIEPCPPPDLETCIPLAHPEDKSSLIGLFYDVVAKPRGFSLQFRLRHGEGDFIWIEVEGTVDQDETGRAIRLRGSFKNINARRQAEDSLRQYATRLESANEKLDSFAYIASHDLKAPLRGLSNLVTWLEEDLPDTVRSSVSDNLSLIRSRLKRMEGLLNDLRLYSHVGREDSESTWIRVSDLLPSLLDLTDDSVEVTLDISDDLPNILCSESAARHIFLNLISNAAKHSERDAVLIRIESVPVADGVEIALEDNGPGIDAAYRDRVFLPFKTLKPRDEREGSGIGLSIVQKMMEALGGAVRVAEPEHGSGARIVLTFPKFAAAPAAPSADLEAVS